MNEYRLTIQRTTSKWGQSVLAADNIRIALMMVHNNVNLDNVENLALVKVEDKTDGS